MDFNNDEDGTLNYGSKKYIAKMVIWYKRTFNSKPREYSSPLERNDHPELDESDLLKLDGIQKYQSMIGACQWAVTCCRFDIMTAVMTMSHFRKAPRNGHMERMKRIYG
jgi:hypothetical protein